MQQGGYAGRRLDTADQPLHLSILSSTSLALHALWLPAHRNESFLPRPQHAAMATATHANALAVGSRRSE